MHDFAVRAFEPLSDLFGAKGPYQEFKNFVCLLNDQIRIHGMKAFRPFLDCVCHASSFSIVARIYPEAEMGVL
jgi:hypothetical protein